MSTSYSWEGIRQVRATLLGARHVPERLCGGFVYLGRYIKCSTLPYLTRLAGMNAIVLHEEMKRLYQMHCRVKLLTCRIFLLINIHRRFELIRQRV